MVTDRSGLEDEIVFQTLNETDRRLVARFLHVSERPVTDDAAMEEYLWLALSFAARRHARAS